MSWHVTWLMQPRAGYPPVNYSGAVALEMSLSACAGLLAGVPLYKVLGLLPAKNLASWPVLGLGLTPPVSVNAVAKAAVAAATDPSIPGGVMDLWQIKENFEG